MALLPALVTMQAPKEIPQDYHCKDKFLIQSVVVQEGITHKEIVPEMVSSCSTQRPTPWMSDRFVSVV